MPKIIGNIATTPMAIPDWNQTNPAKADYIKNKPELANIASSGSYNDLNDVPKGEAGGLATLDDNGKVPTEQLPFNLDGIVEGTYDAESKSFIDGNGEVIVPDSSKIYSDIISGKIYRWGGSVYVEIVNPLALGTTGSTAYRGDYGDVAYKHSQKESGNPHNVSYEELINRPFSLDTIDYILAVFGTNGSRGLKYELYDDYAICTGAVEGFSDTEIEIASMVKGLPVTSIGERAFDNYINLTSVTIPEGVIDIGQQAFRGCTSLSNVNIPNSVTNIGAAAFIGAKFTNITIPNGVTTIGIGAFTNSKLTNIIIPDSVTSIGERAFVSCSSLTSITLSKNITSIGDETFRACVNLTDIIIPDNVTSIGEGAFYQCRNLTSITIPNSVTSIGAEAFSGCTKLTSAVVGDGVESIGYETFKDCNNIVNMTLPFVGGSEDESTYLGYIFGAPSYYENSAYVPSNLKNIVVTKSIGDYAFYNCDNITDIALPGGITIINEYAFYGCGGLVNVYYDGVEEDWEGVEKREGNSILNDVAIHYYTPGLEYELVEDGDEACYKVTGIGSCMREKIAIPSMYNGYPVTTIGEGAFSGYDHLTYVAIPDSVVSIERGAFEACSSIVNINMPNNIATISEYVFAGCTDLENIVIPDGVVTIGSYAFCECSSLGHVILPNSVKYIDESAFEYCNNLVDIVIGNNVVSIGEYAFADCIELEIYYKGTEEEWNRIEPRQCWDEGTTITMTYNYGG